MEGTIRFCVPGIPRPGGSKRGFVNPKNGRVIITEDNKRSKDWRTSVAFAASATIKDPFTGPLHVEFQFVLPRPKGHYGSGRNAHIVKGSSPLYPSVKPDLTKLIRSTEDAMKGIAWRDDSQIVKQTASKHYGVPCAYISITEMVGAALIRGTEESTEAAIQRPA